MTSTTAIPATRHDAFVQAFVDALDLMGFMFADLAAGPLQTPDDALHIRMNYRGTLEPQIAGTCELCTSRTFAAVLAANVLGCDPIDLHEDDVHDCAKELMNVVVGAVTGMLAEDARETFTLEPPTIARIGIDQWHRIAGADDAECLLSTGEPIILRIRES